MGTLPPCETERGLWGSQAQRPFCSPFLAGKTPASMTFPEFQRADYQTVANQGKSSQGPPEARLKGPEKLIKMR